MLWVVAVYAYIQVSTVVLDPMRIMCLHDMCKVCTHHTLVIQWWL